MRNLALSVLFLLFFSVQLFSQQRTTTWEKVYELGGGAFFSVKTDFEGNYLVAGRSDTFDYSGTVVARSMTMKVDPSGSVIWATNFNEGFFSQANSLTLADNAGNCVISGYSYFGGDYGGMFMMKYDASSQMAWAQNYGYPNQEMCGGSIATTTDGGFIVAGNKDSILYVMKTGPSADSLWMRTFPDIKPLTGGFGGVGLCFMGNIRQTTDNGYIICFSSLPLPEMCVMKLNSQGNMQWKKTYNTGAYSMGNYIVETADGNYVACGIQAVTVGAGDQDAKVVKIDPQGNIIWEKEYDKFGFFDGFNAVVMDGNGDFIAAGNTQNDYTGNINFAYVVKFNNLGDTLWTTTDGEGTIFTQECIYGLDLATDGGTILCGSRGSKLFMARIDANGQGFVGINNIHQEQPNDFTISVTDREIAIDVDPSIINPSDNIRINILDMIGRSCNTTWTEHNGKIIVNINNLNQGIYLVEIQNKNIRKTVKFVKQ
ncbi:MAG: T9SS type A sorting domain-containing protein [Bacteroidales bacterium]|nr:T9SS type A sorting domain-containing protein [Bacteroidales bacterium]